MRILLLPIAVILNSCAGVPDAARLPLPPPLTLPKIPAAALACLTDDAVRALNIRDQLLQDRVLTLEEIIKATH